MKSGKAAHRVDGWFLKVFGPRKEDTRLVLELLVNAMRPQGAVNGHAIAVNAMAGKALFRYFNKTEQIDALSTL